MAYLKIIIQKIDDAKEGSNSNYGNTIDVYEQRLHWDWVLDKNPLLISKVIAVVNDLNVKEIS